jgi:cell wall-associated NlpC family hydrolase
VFRLTAALAAAAAAAAFATSAASAQVLPETLPSFTEKNAPGAIAVPLNLSTAPAVPERRSYEQLLGLWQRAGAAYGIPWQVLGAINKIESNFGQGMGPSSAGAIGWMQFLPSTWMDWGMDGNGDGIADPWNPEDAVYSAARYLAAAGAHEDMYRAIFSYNHADWYVRNVLELATRGQIGEGADAWLGPMLAPGGFGLPRFFTPDLGQLLTQARGDVRRARKELRAARRHVQELSRTIRAAQHRAGDPELSGREFVVVDGKIAKLELRLELAEATRDAREEALLGARIRVEDLHRQESTVAFALSNTVALPGVTASGAQAALSWAVSHVGVFGYSQGPTTDRGGDVFAMQQFEPAGPTCDCSSFTRWAMAQTGLDVGLTTVQQWPANGLLPDDETPAETLVVSRGVGPTPPVGGFVPGDMIFWGHGGGNLGHVALYLGSGLIVQCSGQVGSNIRPLAGYGTPTGWVRWHAVTGTTPTTFDIAPAEPADRQLTAVSTTPAQTGRVFTVVGNPVITFTR